MWAICETEPIGAAPVWRAVSTPAMNVDDDGAEAGEQHAELAAGRGDLTRLGHAAHR